MKRHFNTHLEGLDLQFWHDLIECRGKLVSLKKREYLYHKGEPTDAFGYVKPNYKGVKNIILSSVLHQKNNYSFVKILFILSFVSILSACSNSNVENQLSEAESYIIGHPDSRVSLLVQLDTTCMSNDQIARQELLFIYAQSFIWDGAITVESAPDTMIATFLGIGIAESEWLKKKVLCRFVRYCIGLIISLIIFCPFFFGV